MLRFILTCVVLCFQVQVVQFVDVADVHLLFVQLGFVEVLREKGDVRKVIQNNTYIFIYICMFRFYFQSHSMEYTATSWQNSH